MAISQNCFNNLTPDQQNYNIYEQLKQVAGFEIPTYDEIDIAYYGVTNNIATVQYLNGGNVVATLTLVYAVQPPVANDANLVNITIAYP
jgi:hypothetical protein